jgi:hypothetical protein
MSHVLTLSEITLSWNLTARLVHWKGWMSILHRLIFRSLRSTIWFFFSIFMHFPSANTNCVWSPTQVGTFCFPNFLFCVLQPAVSILMCGNHGEKKMTSSYLSIYQAIIVHFFYNMMICQGCFVVIGPLWRSLSCVQYIGFYGCLYC